MRGKATLVARTNRRSILDGRSRPSFQPPVLQIEPEAKDKNRNNPDGWRMPYHRYGIEADGRLVFARVYRPGNINADAHRQDNCGDEQSKQARDNALPQVHGISPLIPAAELFHPLTFAVLKIKHHFDGAMAMLLAADHKGVFVLVEPEAMRY